jgi:ubiquinone/menaquinone biosynthesis C-methylase UbiE
MARWRDRVVGAVEPAPATPGPTGAEQAFPEDRWFADHIGAARQVIEFLGGDGLSVEGWVVADIGSGDGIIDLGLVHEGRPARLVGFDVNLTDPDDLLARARDEGYVDELPAELEFVESATDRIPAEDASFDCLVSWSCFEHVSEPLAMATEMRRVIRPDGLLFLQLWPFYYSEHGGHLFDWYPRGFAHLVHPHDEIRRRLLEDDVKPHSEYIWNEFSNLNRITVDDLGEVLRKGGFDVVKVELITNACHIPPEASHLPLSQLLVSGIKLLARPRS